MNVLRGLFYGTATFLLAPIAVSGIELVQAVKGADSLFGSLYLEELQQVAELIVIAGPIVFVVGA